MSTEFVNKSQLPAEGKTRDSDFTVVATHGQLERIRIRVFSGKKWIFSDGMPHLLAAWT